MMMNVVSPLQEARASYPLSLPAVLKDIATVSLEEGDVVTPKRDVESLAELFPNIASQPLARFVVGTEPVEHTQKRVGVVLSGGQAPGGHNVIAGIFDGLKALCKESILYGFLGGPSGIVDNKVVELTYEALEAYRNQGGFDLIGSGRTKIESEQQFAAVEKTIKDLKLDTIVVIGGDDSNTNAALLAEYCAERGMATTVVGVPKTIDGDLKNEYIEVSFGFDTATKVYSELIGNILRDCISAKKYYHFIKLMGRSASHIALEAALQTHPNMTLISEEVAAKKMTLNDVTNDICDMVSARSADGKNYGVVLIPEGLIEFIPEMKTLISELNKLLATGSPFAVKLEAMDAFEDKIITVSGALTVSSQQCFASLPRDIQEQLLADRDPHGNVQVSRIETEKLLMKTVEAELARRKASGGYAGAFKAQPHFLGYEGRAAMPSNFDCSYCYSLGYAAALLADAERTGYMAVVRNLANGIEDWTLGGIPLVSMMSMEERHGAKKPVIQKALVEVDGTLFSQFAAVRDEWKKDDSYRYPGPIQFFGDKHITDIPNITLLYEYGSAL
jgi:diphosphate-dependent phosphofructokinase